MTFLRRNRGQNGFTLLEALVAASVVGVVFTVAMSSWGSFAKNGRRGIWHEHAQVLARQRLAEFAQDPVNDLSADTDLLFGGMKFGYKLNYQPVADTDWLPLALAPASKRLYRVSIDVYWSEPGKPPPSEPGFTLRTTLYKTALGGPTSGR